MSARDSLYKCSSKWSFHLAVTAATGLPLPNTWWSGDSTSVVAFSHTSTTYGLEINDNTSPPSPTYYTIAPSSGQASLVSCTCAWWQVNRHQRTCIHCVHVIYITLIGTLCLSWGTTLVRECVCVCVMLMLLPSKASCNPSRVTKAIRSVCIVPEYAPTPPGEVDDVANVVSFTLLPFTVLNATDRKSQRRSLNSMNSKQRSTTSATSEWQLLKSTI